MDASVSPIQRVNFSSWPVMFVKLTSQIPKLTCQLGETDASTSTVDTSFSWNWLVKSRSRRVSLVKITRQLQQLTRQLRETGIRKYFSTTILEKEKIRKKNKNEKWTLTKCSWNIPQNNIVSIQKRNQYAPYLQWIVYNDLQLHTWRKPQNDMVLQLRCAQSLSNSLKQVDVRP